MEELKSMYRRHRELVLYLFTGGLTTVLNYLVYLLSDRLFAGHAWQVELATGIAWAVSVLFAYLTNRSWVFRSQAVGFGPVCRELGAFVAARLFSGLLDLGIMVVAVKHMDFDGKIVKLLSNLLVIVLNYLLSKLIIFRKPAKNK